MSYDLLLVPAEAGQNADDVYAWIERADEEPGPPGPVAAGLAAALVAADPRYESTAGEEWIQVMADGGLEITVYGPYADISFPYWASLDPDVLLADIRRTVAIVGAETGWRVFDPQLDRLVDPAADAGEIRRMFDDGRSVVQEMAAEDAAPRKPLWRRLLGQ